MSGPLEPIRNAVRHLVCYGVRPLSRITPPAQVFANNQLAPEVLRLGGEQELCVPSLKRVLPP